MDAVRTWLDRAARRADRVPRIEEALLGGRFARYAFHRLRFFAARTGVAASLHAARIVLAFRIFSTRDFGLILAVEAAASLVSSFWWGSLEPMREDVREAFAAGKPRLAEARIERSLARSIRLSLAVAAAGAAWSAVRSFSADGFGPSDLFLLAVSLRLAADVVLRSYHSGVFAVRRVYRPFWSLAGLEILGFGGGLSLWPIVGAWALPAASLLSAAAASALSYIYSARAYRHVGIAPRPHLRRRKERSGGPRHLLEGWDSGAAYALMRTDGILPLALLAAGRRGMPAAAAFVLAAAPLVRAGFDWTQLFYFDLKRLDRPLLGTLRASFERRLHLLAVPVGAFSWAGALILGTLFFRGFSPALAAGSAAFFLVRSLAASLEMRAFARRAYGRLFGAGLFILLGTAGACLMLRDETRSVAAAGSGFLLAAAWLAPRFGRNEGGTRRRWKTAIPLPDWGLSLRRTGKPVMIGMACFCAGSPHRGMDEPDRWREEDRWAHLRIAEATARRLGPDGETALSGPARIIWHGPPPGGGIDKSWLLAEGMGLLGRVETAGPFAGGPAAADWLAGSGWLGGRPRSNHGAAAAGRDALAALFRARVPGGLVLGPGLPPPPGWSLLPGETRREIWREALAYASGGRHGPRGAFDVTVSLDGGTIGLVFATPANFDLPARCGWRREIRSRNLADLLRGSSSDRG